MNKYTEWNKGDSYMRRDLLMAEQELMEEPLIRYSLSSVTRTAVKKAGYDSGRSFDALDMQILAIIAMGKCMTLRQLRAYLLLKGEKVKNEDLRDRINLMKDDGMLVEVRYYKKEDEADDLNCSYMVSYQSNDILRSLGAPRIDPRENYAINHQMGTRLANCASLLWNQIILNQLLYNPGIGCFRIQELVQIGKNMSISVPLGITIKGRLCVFDMFRSYYDLEEIRRRLDNWKNYAEQKDKSFVLVVICSSAEHEMWIAGCIREIRSDRISFATSTEEKWIHASPGTVCFRDVCL